MATSPRKLDREHEAKVQRLREKTSRGGGGRTLRFASSRATRGQGSWQKSGRQVGLLIKIHAGGAAGDAYAEKSEQAQFIESNMFGRTAQDRAKEWSLDAARHPRVNQKNLIVHVSFSRPSNAQLTPAQWAKACQIFLLKIGAADVNYIATRHQNTSNDHVHLIFSRSLPDGNLVSMSNNRWAWRQACREVERELGIQVPDRPAERQTAPTPGSDVMVSAQRRAARMGASDPFINPNLIAEALSKSASYEQFSAALKSGQIEVKEAEKNGKVTGILLRKSGSEEWLAGSSISREFSLPRIQAQFQLRQKALQQQEHEIHIQRQRQAFEQHRQQQAIQSQQVTRPRGG